MKHAFRLLIFNLLIFFSCSDNKDTLEGEIENNPPQLFNVTIENITEDGAEIHWTQAIDLDDDKVVYDIYLNDVLLINNTSVLNYTVVDLNENVNYNGKIIASDGKNEINVDFSFTTLEHIVRIFQGDVVLNTQKEVDDFGNNQYEIIEGNLIINDLEQEDEYLIIDLTSLINLTKVTEGVEISSLGLISLEGINKLAYIGGNLKVLCDYLTNLDGLENLSEVQDITVTGRFLESLKGLSRLTEIGNLFIGVNNELKNLEGLENITKVNGIFFSNMNALVDITQLSNVSGNVQNIFIGSNDSLLSLEGLHSISNISNSFELYRNLSLQNLDHLSNMTFDGIAKVNIESNGSLKNIDGLINLEATSGDFYLYDNAALKNLDGLDNLKKVGGSLHIWYNPQLEHLDGLVNLQTIGATGLILHKNPLITNLNSLSSLSLIQGNLQITDNSTLTDLCGIRNLILSGGLHEGASYVVHLNSFNPTRENMIDGNCSN